MSLNIIFENRSHHHLKRQPAAADGVIEEHARGMNACLIFLGESHSAESIAAKDVILPSRQRKY